MNPRFAAVAAASLGVLILMGSALPGSRANADELKTFAIEQDVPVLAVVDVGTVGRSHADMLAFEAAIVADDGTKGTLTGVLITVDLPIGPGDIQEDRIGQLVFDLGAGDSIVVVGASVYAETATEMDVDLPQVRAVVGGTGRFLGARGQVTTVRHDDGTYEHAFELLD